MSIYQGNAYLDPSRYPKRSRVGGFLVDAVRTLRPGHEADPYGESRSAEYWNLGMHPDQISHAKALGDEELRLAQMDDYAQRQALERDKFNWEKAQLLRSLTLDPSLSMTAGQKALYDQDMARVGASQQVIDDSTALARQADRTLNVLATEDTNLGAIEGTAQQWLGNWFETEASIKTADLTMAQKEAALDVAQKLKGALSNKELDFAVSTVPQPSDNEQVWQNWYFRLMVGAKVSEEMARRYQAAADDPAKLRELSKNRKTIENELIEQYGGYRADAGRRQAQSGLGTLGRPPSMDKYLVGSS